MRTNRRSGFTLIELMIVVAIIAIIAAIAIPGLLRARISSNEVSAIGTLKSLSTSQEQFKSQNVVDCDGDGTGEYGFFQELCGTSLTRVNLALTGPIVNPTFLAATFGTTAAGNGGIANKSGYNFRIFLPVAAALGPPLPEAAPLAVGVLLDANNQETRWAAYGWPTSAGTSGNRCFVINQEGQVYQAPNAAPLYDGAVGPATGNQAYAAAANLTGSIVSNGAAALDGQTWTPSGG